MFVLMCVHPFGKYEKGQIITDQTEIDMLSNDRDHHFVRLARNAPDAVVTVEETPVEG